MKIWQAIAAAALSAALFHLGTGLDPVPWVTWLAPLPVLLVASRVKGWAAFGAGTFTWAAGQAALWPYFLNVIELPLLIIAVSQLAAALVFGLAVVGHRFLLLRGRPLSGAVVVPAAWVVMEYVISLVMPHGAWWSLAYTQAEVLPVLQTASTTGIWGITFLLLGVPSAVSAVVGARSAARNEPVGRRADTGGVSSTPGRTPDAPGPGAAGPGAGGPGSGGPGSGGPGSGGPGSGGPGAGSAGAG
ncbi:hypothetical protein, partial [Nonomuraea sp. SBT364]|uniref:hypothetical protein n=1 Tax=Nonomuraea sp. SBT364 TaxID=1580530 RepID=UPI00066C50AE